MIFWRISQHADLSGHGGRLVSGRWHTRGEPVVYMAECSPGAMLETIAHLQSSLPPLTLQLIRIEAPDSVSVTTLSAPDGTLQFLELTRMLGDDWLSSGETALARVPSVLAPHAWNVLLNPQHPDAAACRITDLIRFRPDSRLV